MTMLAIPFPNIDPVAFSIGPVAVRWYGLAYMAGLLFGWLYVKRLVATKRLWAAQKPPFDASAVDDLLLWTAIGVVVGGRLGQVLFYEFPYYAADPVRILKVWEGGMAFHGGLIGAILAIVVFSRVKGVSALSVLDLAAASVPVGIMLGRIANFINGELWGNVSSVPWAMVFPAKEAGPYARHPSQLYEALLEGLVLFLVLRYLTHTRLALKRPGITGGVFMAGYGLARIVCELFRQRDPDGPFEFGVITTGMVYSLPMVLVGVIAILLIGRPRTEGRA